MPPTIEETRRYLHEHIPVSRHMGVDVASAAFDGVVLTAPLAPNLNHRNTGFGGSVSALAILSGWTLVWFRLRAADHRAGIVIQRNAMEYVRSVDSDFRAHAPAPGAEAWNRFMETLARKGRARIVLESRILCGDSVAGRFRGSYVALDE